MLPSLPRYKLFTIFLGNRGLVQRSFQGLICEAILCWSCRQVSLRHAPGLRGEMGSPAMPWEMPWECHKQKMSF